MTFLIISILVPVLVYFLLPLLIEKATGSSPAERTWLIVAGLFYFVSWYLPSPEIFGQQTAATTHFVGGGIFSGFVWLYMKKQLRWQSKWYIELLSLLALVSLLGVLNELFELFVVLIGLVGLSLTDTSWDLLMNTLGVLTFWLVYMTMVFSLRNSSQSK